MNTSILIIDDDVSIVRMLKQQLEKEEFQVWTAASGHEATKRIMDQRPDVVITDMIMPERDGCGIISQLKLLWPAAKIIAMSGGGSISAEMCLQMAQDLGADKVMRKPFERQELIHTIGELVHAAPVC
jgi:two-component system chemotaxis response regulator CheY